MPKGVARLTDDICFMQEARAGMPSLMQASLSNASRPTFKSWMWMPPSSGTATATSFQDIGTPRVGGVQSSPFARGPAANVAPNFGVPGVQTTAGMPAANVAPHFGVPGVQDTAGRAANLAPSLGAPGLQNAAGVPAVNMSPSLGVPGSPDAAGKMESAGLSGPDSFGSSAVTSQGLVPSGRSRGHTVGEPSGDGIPGPRSGTQALPSRLRGHPVRVATPHARHRRSLICGVAAQEAGGEGRVVCGIPVRRDRRTGAPYVVPLYEQPQLGGGVRPAASPDLVAQRAQAAASVRLRSQALELLARFLDTAPSEAAADAGSPTLAPGLYPVPSKSAPAGMELVDMDNTRGVAPGIALPGGFL